MNKTSYQNLQIMQHNVARSTNIMHSCLETAIKKGVHFVLLQEPWIAKNDVSITVSHPAYTCILPHNIENIRPRVAIFAKKISAYSFCHRSDLCQDPDMIILDIAGLGLKFQLINIYNEQSLTENNQEFTIFKVLTKINPENNALICGNFNAHHPWWNSRIRNGIRSDELINWLEKFNFELVNEPDAMTFCRYQTNSNLISESMLNLSFARGNIIS